MKVHTLKYCYAAEIEIQASIDKVWNVLRDAASYAKWNPFTPKVDSSWNIGDPVLLQVQMKPGKKAISQKEVLRKLDPPNEIVWGMNWSTFLRAERRQVLSESKNGATKYFTEDIIQGILSPIVHKIYGKHIQRGFEGVAAALKDYIENE